MTALHDRLAALADDAPPGGPSPDLWDRGRRIARRRRVGTAVIVAVVVLAVGALGAADWLRSRPAPGPADSAPALPDRIWAPSRWLPGTGDAGPLGQLAAVQEAARGGWTGTRDGVVGISATTGEYRFLDLPDQVHGAALSPDGRHVAYWYRGKTEESPSSATGPVVGVAAYDTSTGEVTRRPVPTDHGLSPDDLVWADPDRLVYSYHHYTGGDAESQMARSTGNLPSGLRIWHPATGTDDDSLVTALGVFVHVETSTGRGQLLLSGSDEPGFVDLDHPADAISFQVSMLSYSQSAAVNEAGTRIAWPRGTSSPNVIAVGRIRDGERVDHEEVPGRSRTFRVWAWLDDDHVAAVRRFGGQIGPSALMSVDVHTGESTQLLRFPRDTYGTTTQLATDLLDLPTVAREEPPRPLDPRVVTVLTVMLVLGGLGALLLWRRSARP